AATFAADGRVGLLDAGETAPFDQTDTKQLVVYVPAAAPPRRSHVDAYLMAPWTRDDLIEYLLACHRERCAAVMTRVRDDDLALFRGVPELWAVLLDQLAADESIPAVRTALLRFLEQELPDTDVVCRARTACLNLMTVAKPPADAPAGFPPVVMRVLRHRAVQVELAAERIVADLREGGDCDYLACRLPRDLVRAAARLLPPDDRAAERLREFAAGPAWRQAMSASLLHALHVGWEPIWLTEPDFRGAYFEGAVWPDMILANAHLEGTDLSAADLTGADLSGVSASAARFRSAKLRGASLDQLIAAHADFSGAVLGAARGAAAVLDRADLSGANFEDAVFPNASFAETTLKQVNFTAADLRGGLFRDAEIDDSDFTAAKLHGANLAGLK